MAVKTFTQGEKLTYTDTNTYLANGGLVFVKEVAIGTGVASVDVTSCFSSTYDNYIVSYQNMGVSVTGQSIQAALLVGTTPNAANFDGNTFYTNAGGGAGLTNAAYANVLRVDVGSMNTTYKNASIFEVKQPNLPTGTIIEFRSIDTTFYRFGGYILKNNTQYDGIRLQPFSGTMTGGTITVYGFRKG